MFLDFQFKKIFFYLYYLLFRNVRIVVLWFIYFLLYMTKTLKNSMHLKIIYLIMIMKNNLFILSIKISIRKFNLIMKNMLS